jgi:hypothetical protein
MRTLLARCPQDSRLGPTSGKRVKALPSTEGGSAAAAAWKRPPPASHTHRRTSPGLHFAGGSDSGA